MALDEGSFWRIAEATRMSVIVDAEEYFRHARTAMLQARHRIMLIGWDFDARIRLVHEPLDPAEPATVGDFIHWLVERTPTLEVHLLRWDVGALKTLVRGSNIFTLAKWMRHPRMHTKLDSFHPTGGSHHQKIVVIDDCFAFCGGIDMTNDRWDTRCHRDGDEGRIEPNGKPYGPWHDATSALQGPVAAALGELGRERWERAGGTPLEPVPSVSDCWPEGLEADFTGVQVGIARTRPDMPDCAEVREIEALFVEQIGRAKRNIYAESQYFASRKIAEAIAARLGEVEGPEIVIINPLTAQGWLEPVAMDTARARLFSALKHRDKYDRLRIYHPFTAGGEPIYVHAKVMIVDERILRIGSANMNNRSMGLDTECDVTIDAGDEGEAAVRAIRDGLIAEHLDVTPDTIMREIEARASLIETIEALRGSGRSLRPYQIPDLSEVEKWLADNEVLDPESPSEMFEATTRKGLLRRLPWHKG
ncbi:phospholipase D-like domain-containing protein [Sphingobium sufflavum]|uniref:phospholipase D-like domain-containing protein n=1 Tax=Sphingobium sufflavum TaxID=1129547 RepID=UPI001F430DC4|nr:phospholipase D-like domain-containing protein [Sphingobium sufflavum]MCE7796631.1 phospholipase D-like domain-containing protein [Sphingobium sufflavum]